MLNVNIKIGKYWWLQVLGNLRTHFISIFMHMQTDTESSPIINVTLTLLSLAHGQAHNRSAWQWGGAWVLLAEYNETHLLFIAPCHPSQNPSTSISAPVLAHWCKVSWADKLTTYAKLIEPELLEPVRLISLSGTRRCVYHANTNCAWGASPWGQKRQNLTGRPLNKWPPTLLAQQLIPSVLNIGGHHIWLLFKAL